MVICPECRGIGGYHKPSCTLRARQAAAQAPRSVTQAQAGTSTTAEAGRALSGPERLRRVAGQIDKISFLTKDMDLIPLSADLWALADDWESVKAEAWDAGAEAAREVALDDGPLPPNPYRRP